MYGTIAYVKGPFTLVLTQTNFRFIIENSTDSTEQI